VHFNAEDSGLRREKNLSALKVLTIILNQNHLNKLILSTVTTILIASLCSCSFLESSSDAGSESFNSPSPSIVSSARLYLAKGSFSSTEFEQFSLSGNSLFFECGKILRGKNIPEKQGVVTLEAENSSEIMLLGLEILGRASVNNPLSLSEPGDLKGFADSGRIVLNLTTKDNKTAELNSALLEVSEPTTALEHSLLKFSVALRAAIKEARGDQELCGNESFFGIE
jgi:hypothetical protein